MTRMAGLYFEQELEHEKRVKCSMIKRYVMIPPVAARSEPPCLSID